MEIHQQPIGPSIRSLLTAGDRAKRNFNVTIIYGHSFSRFGQNLKAHRVRVRGAQLDTRTRTAGAIPGPTATATFRPSAPPKPAIRMAAVGHPVLALHALHSSDSVLTRSA